MLDATTVSDRPFFSDLSKNRQILLSTQNARVSLFASVFIVLCNSLLHSYTLGHVIFYNLFKLCLFLKKKQTNIFTRLKLVYLKMELVKCTMEFWLRLISKWIKTWFMFHWSKLGTTTTFPPCFRLSNQSIVYLRKMHLKLTRIYYLLKSVG